MSSDDYALAHGDVLALLPAIRLKRGGAAFADGTMLTRREAEVLEFIWAGLSHAEIARALGLKLSAVDQYSSHLNVKLGLPRARLVLLWDRARGPLA